MGGLTCGGIRNIFSSSFTKFTKRKDSTKSPDNREGVEKSSYFDNISKKKNLQACTNFCQTLKTNVPALFSKLATAQTHSTDNEFDKALKTFGKPFLQLGIELKKNEAGFIEIVKKGTLSEDKILIPSYPLFNRNEKKHFKVITVNSYDEANPDSSRIPDQTAEAKEDLKEHFKKALYDENVHALYENANAIAIVNNNIKELQTSLAKEIKKLVPGNRRSEEEKSEIHNKIKELDASIDQEQDKLEKELNKGQQAKNKELKAIFDDIDKLDTLNQKAVQVLLQKHLGTINSRLEAFDTKNTDKVSSRNLSIQRGELEEIFNDIDNLDTLNQKGKEELLQKHLKIIDSKLKTLDAKDTDKASDSNKEEIIEESNQFSSREEDQSRVSLTINSMDQAEKKLDEILNNLGIVFKKDKFEIVSEISDEKALIVDGNGELKWTDKIGLEKDEAKRAMKEVSNLWKGVFGTDIHFKDIPVLTQKELLKAVQENFEKPIQKNIDEQEAREMPRFSNQLFVDEEVKELSEVSDAMLNNLDEADKIINSEVIQYIQHLLNEGFPGGGAKDDGKTSIPNSLCLAFYPELANNSNVKKVRSGKRDSLVKDETKNLSEGLSAEIFETESSL